MKASTADRLAALSSMERVRILGHLVAAGRLAEIPSLVPPRDHRTPARLSPAQEDLWVYESLYPGTGALNLCCAYHFDRPVDPALVDEALTAVLADHDILRMRVTGSLAAPCPTFPAGPFHAERMDLRATPAALSDILAEFSRSPFEPGSHLVQGRFIGVDDDHATLVLKLHHMVTDWWSFDVLHSDFSAAYQAVANRATPPRRRPAIQYADFAAWQRELEAAGVFDAQLDFWRDYLAEPPAALTIGGHHLAGKPGIAHIPVKVGRPAETAIRAFAREHGVTVYAVLMTAFAVLAHRLSGERDMVIGTPIANRSARGLERLIGYVMNAVPTRWRIGPNDSFVGLVKRFAAEFPRILANCDVPVGRIVAALDPPRLPGRSSLFQWVFMYLPTQAGVRALREFSVPERIQTGGEHDVVGVMQDTDDGLVGSIEIRTDMYSAELVRHWADSFQVLLEGLLTRPASPVDQVELLASGMRTRMLDLSADQSPCPPATSLAGLAARWAVRTPGAIAIESAGVSLTYAELTTRARLLARDLADRGVEPGTVVAVVLPRSAAMILTLLAVQHAGAAYLPVDPGYPAERIRYILGDATPVLLVTDAVTAGILPDMATPRLVLDPHQPAAACGALGAVLRPQQREAGYVMYTSGSTGRPKGVVVTSEGIAGVTDAMVRLLDLSPASRVLQLGSPSFDISVAELCMAFGAGGTLVIPPAGPLAGDLLAATLTESRISALVVPPAVLASVPAGPYPHLRSVCLAGEACPASLVATWSSDGRTVINGYGPTEATVGATFSEPLRPAAGTPPIGRPVAGARAYVLDAWLRPVPAGVPGELYLAGAGLARGYYGRPAATAERFVADLHAVRPGTRMYRTGDIARWRADGQLEFVSRADGQISRHGLRIEPGEVETVLAMHDSIAQVVVVAHEDGQHRQRLVGYVVSATRHAPDHDVLRRHALSMLPAYMVPDVFVALDSLPLTAHGKLDRTALPAPPSPALSGASAADGPERTLCELFTELLGTPAGPRDDFFDLGGDSIMAIQLASRAKDAGLRFTPQEVFASRTPVSLAEIARTAKPADMPPDPGTGQFPLTPMMHWWREQGGQADAFTMSALLAVPAGTSSRQVATALRVLARIHGALRMRLARSPDGSWGLNVAPEQQGSGVSLDVTDAAGLRLAELRQAAMKVAGRTRLDPEAGRMAAATWFDRGTQEDGRLLLTLHHLAADGVSWRIIAEELPGLLSGQQQPRSEGTSFARWARLLTESAHTDRVAAELPGWERALSGPSARLVPDGRKLAGPRGTFAMSLPADMTDRLLTTVTAGFRCGPQDIMLTALLAAAVRWRGDGHGTGLLVDVEGHGRETSSSEIDLTRTVGWFTTQYPVRLDAGLAGCADFWLDGPASSRALKQVKEQMRDIPADGLGYGLLRYLNRERASRLACLTGPDIRFNYLGRFVAGDSAGVELIGPVESAPPLAHAVELDAIVEATAEGPRLVANWSYAEQLMTAARARELAASWFAALAVIAGNAGQPWSGGASSSDFPLVDLTQQEIDAFELDLGHLSGDERS